MSDNGILEALNSQIPLFDLNFEQEMRGKT